MRTQILLRRMAHRQRVGHGKPIKEYNAPVYKHYIPIESCDMSVRLLHTLQAYAQYYGFELKYLNDLEGVNNEIIRFRNCGAKTVKELVDLLNKYKINHTIHFYFTEQ